MARKREASRPETETGRPQRPNQRRQEAPGYEDEFEEDLNIRAAIDEDEDEDEPGNSAPRNRPENRNAPQGAKRRQAKDGF